MKVKQIVFTKPGTAELLEKEIDAPKAGEVQVRLAVSTISSGTERANLVGTFSSSTKLESNLDKLSFKLLLLENTPCWRKYTTLVSLNAINDLSYWS